MPARSVPRYRAGVYVTQRQGGSSGQRQTRKNIVHGSFNKSDKTIDEISIRMVLELGEVKH